MTESRYRGNELNNAMLYPRTIANHTPLAHALQVRVSPSLASHHVIHQTSPARWA